jgi:SH3-like domain-containing protein
MNTVASTTRPHSGRRTIVPAVDNLATIALPALRGVFAPIALLTVTVLLTFVAIGQAQRTAPHADAVAAQPVVNIFANPSADSDVTSQVLYGSGVVILEKKEGWTKIRTADEYTGWVASSDLRPGVYPADHRLMRVSTIGLNVYREPDVTKHAPMLHLPWESILEAIPDAPGISERWLAVRLVDGRTGWVQRGDVTTTPSAPLSIDETIALGKRFLGITYTWGGVSSFGFDCSGFVQMLARQRGYEIPRDADAQAAWSGVSAVDRKALLPGDLLYFGSSPAHITHTGMYIGNGEFIHDTVHDHPGVQISRLDDQPWTHLLVASRRIK